MSVVSAVVNPWFKRFHFNRKLWLYTSLIEVRDVIVSSLQQKQGSQWWIKLKKSYVFLCQKLYHEYESPFQTVVSTELVNCTLSSVEKSAERRSPEWEHHALWTPDRLECYETRADIKQEPGVRRQRSPTEMSTASKVTLAVTTAVSLGVIWTVHSKQVSKPVQRKMCWSPVQVEDRAKLHAGIERDLERQAKKRVVNQQLLVQQQELTKLYKQAEATEAQGVKEA